MSSYVENSVLYADICDWLERRKENPSAQMGVYTQKAIITIANNLVKRWNFQNYTYRDEMALDAIEICVRYLQNYDPKYTNPHAYITKNCFNACVSRLKKENALLRIKYKYFLNAVPDIEEFDDDGNQIQIDYSFYKDIGEKLKEKAVSDKPNSSTDDDELTSLELFMSEPDVYLLEEEADKPIEAESY